MKFLKYLQEEYFGIVNSKYLGKPSVAEIYKNPSPSELRKNIIKDKDPDVRYIIDIDKKNLYVWCAYDLNHDKVIKDLGIKLNRYFRGTGDAKSGKIAFPEGEFVNCETRDVVNFRNNSEWITKYFDKFNERMTDTLIDFWKRMGYTL
jgi:hypothetical protein